MGGAQSSEIKAGSAVTGKWCKRVEMPKGVVGEQMPGGMRPGSSFKSFTPTLLQELLEKKDAKALYAEFEAEVSKDCGGEFFSGWNSPKIMEKVTKFQPRFAEKRLRVAYHMVMWYQYVYNQYGGSTFVARRRNQSSPHLQPILALTTSVLASRCSQDEVLQVLHGALFGASPNSCGASVRLGPSISLMALVAPTLAAADVLGPRL